MTRIAVTGHRALPPGAITPIAQRIRTHLEGLVPELTGVSCLADGADSLFATEVVRLRGSLEVIVPATNYRGELPVEHHATYDALCAQAARVQRLTFVESTPQAHLTASELMVDQADQLLAVWDGLPARGTGGTADVVAYARSRNIPVTVVWPEGTVR